MAALNFPTENLVAGVTQYTSDLGTTYIWDGVKWVGHSAGGAVGTNSISNNGNTVQVNADGDLVLPAYTLPNTAGTEAQVLTWPAEGTVLEWTDQTGTGGGGGLTIADFGEGFSLTASNKIVTSKLYSTNETNPNQHYRLELDTNGVVVLPDQSIINGSTMRGVYGTGELNYTALTIGPDAAHQEESWIWVDAGGAHIGTSYSGDINPTQQWNFSNDGYFTFPQGGSLGYDAESDSTQITYQGNISLNNAGGTWMFGANDGTLSLAGDILVGANDGHIYIDEALSGATSIRWVNTELDTTLFRVYTDGKEDLNNEQLEIGYAADEGFYISTTENVNGLWNNPGDDHSWHFDKTGNLVLPEGGDILNSSGQSVLGGGVSGTANRVQFDNGGSISQVADEAPGRYNIVIDAEKDIIFNTDEDSQQFRFTSTGNLQLPQGSTISDQPNSVDITVGRINESPYWYNLFGDTGATANNNNYANLALNGSVVHDAGGNVYVLGSTVSYNNFDSNNLFLKYSPEGNLLWRRTWTDQNGMDCGSYNASLRYIAANVDIGTQDTIVWAAQVPWNNVSYIGTMDTEGNLVDQYGNVRLPTRLDDFRVTDLIWGGNVPGVSDSVVGVVGQLFYPGPGYHFPALGGVDLANAAVLGFSTVMPDGTNLNYGDGNSPPSWVNQYKAVVDVPAHGDTLPFTAAVGTYYDGDWSHAMLSTQVGVSTYTWGIGDNYPTDDIIGEDLCCDTNGNVYVIVNNITSNTSVLIKVSAASLDVNEAIWKLSLGPFTSDGFYATAVTYDNGYVYVLGQYSVDATSDTDAILIKVGIANGNVVWQRRIGSPGEDGVNFFGAPGWESSSGISVYDGVVAISFATEARTPGLNLGPPELNIVTLQYPTDGSLLGSYGDFVISDFDVGNESSNYNVLSIVTSLGGDGVSSGFATLQATTASVGTGWTNTQWDMDQNREVFDSQTWRFNYDGTFETKEIRRQTDVKITANTVSGVNAATWTFQNNKGLRFPDGSVQYGAYVETEIALDGGSAVTVFNIPLAVTVADGGGSGTRHGVTDPVYDGNYGNNYVLDGGGA